MNERATKQNTLLSRFGSSAELLVRTTPEAADMVNLARLVDFLLIQADRKTRGYVAEGNRADYEMTKKELAKACQSMLQILGAEMARHKLDVSGDGFVARLAQRYGIFADNIDRRLVQK